MKLKNQNSPDWMQPGKAGFFVAKNVQKRTVEGYIKVIDLTGKSYRLKK